MTAPPSIPPYKVYTTLFDAEVSASELLNEIPREQKKAIPASEQSGELGQVVVAPHFGPRVLVTLLVDHSGSMKGGPAQWTATALRQVGSILEKSEIAFEILGYTTRSWRGGNARNMWISEGSPPMPGRLCELLHIVYRDANSPSPTWSQDLDLMNNEGVLKENIDGEALLWAFKRSQAFKPSFWLCVMVSDGAPVDEATIEANGVISEEYFSILHYHLVDTIVEIDTKLNTQLAAFSINFDLSQYFEDSDYALIDSDDTNILAEFVCGLLKAER